MKSQFTKVDTASKFMRNRLGVKRLSSKQAQEVCCAVARNNARALNPRLDNNSMEDLMRHENDVKIFGVLRDRIQNILEGIVFENYRASRSKWAGGEKTLTFFYTQKPGSTGVSQRAWSTNGKWSGTNTVFNIGIQRNWYTEVFCQGLAEIEGMLVTHAIEIEPNLYEVSWLKQSVGFSLRVERGYVYNPEPGLRIHGTTIDSVKKPAHS